MLKPKALGNGMAAAGLIVYAVCRLAVLIAPDFVFGISRSWFHGINIEPSTAESFSLPLFLYGLLTFGIFAWIFGYLLAYAYNRFNK